MKSERSKLIAIRLDHAKAALSEVEKYHIENELWNTAVNRLYYACFYAVTALLHSVGRDSKTHAGVQSAFGQYFIKPGIINKETGKFFTTLFEMRQDADYEDFVDFEANDVLPLVPQNVNSQYSFIGGNL